MKTIRAIIIAAGVWIFGVTAFSLSYYLPVLNNLDLQANIVLALVLIPLAIFATKLYYKNPTDFSSYKVAIIMFLTLACLDALITVPYLMQPLGLGYSDFFLNASFWLIALEFLTVSILTGNLKKIHHANIN
ncbi:DUF5367 family protein [Seonamhaeicola marinus]|uniref:DUF5367 domain-containing protein n=1 Tax=Seonamhaeicola marinus TaxID=1912246 RepID=A0A5D0HF29_9FLAO|nr:DUF5367 family protein [Seonamhaeicola marinus]TYA69896.1 hypothetical protein FUA24_21625 [Seonamhaeicola marinus]